MKKTLWIIIWLFYQLSSGNDMTGRNKIASARIQSKTAIDVVFTGPAPAVSLSDVSISAGAGILEIGGNGSVLRLRTTPLDVRQNYRIRVKGSGDRELLPDGILDEFMSDKPLGCVIENGNRSFRVFAPRAVQVKLELFGHFDDPFGEIREMKRDGDGVWELTLEGALSGKWYGYRI